MRRTQADGTGRTRRPARRAGPVARLGAAVVVALAAAVVAGACGTTTSDAGPAGTPATSAPATATTAPATATSSTTAPTTAEPTTTTALATFDARAVLERLVVDDRPSPSIPYRRDDWSHWDDIDGNGCDAREDALIAASLEPPELGPGCKVLSGEWVSPYDGVVTNDPGAIQIDHLVPLADAHRSGGWQWGAARRRLFANDQAELVASSGAANQSKGDKAPDRWRPPVREVWCAYAMAWVRVKVTYDLTVTTSERDALGQMLDTCPPDAPADARPGGPLGVPPTTAPPAPVASDPPAPLPAGGGGDVDYANCTAARAAGAAPILRGEPGYRSRLDGDDDGIACE